MREVAICEECDKMRRVGLALMLEEDMKEAGHPIQYCVCKESKMIIGSIWRDKREGINLSFRLKIVGIQMEVFFVQASYDKGVTWVGDTERWLVTAFGDLERVNYPSDKRFKKI